ncbi:MAG: chemotaxis response regulator protein-glutamate methylesterase [bacterium]
MPGGKIKVLVVDDSKYMRFVLTKILKEDPEIEIVGEARDGIDALKKLGELEPDVVTLDVEMPRMDGLETLRRIFEVRPTPVLMVSQHTKSGGEITIRALEAGAIDFIQKPEGKDSLTMEKVKDELLTKVKMAAGVKMDGAVDSGPPEAEPVQDRKKEFNVAEMERVVVIGSSTGGPKALVTVLTRIPADAPLGIIVVQHMPPKFTSSLASRLDRVAPMAVSEARDIDQISQGRILIAPGGFHMRITMDGTIRLSDAEAIYGLKPAADITMKDAAQLYGDRVVGVVLTGMGSDGTNGCRIIRESGGVTIAQLASTCIVDGMPVSLINAGQADRVVALDKIAGEILNLV